MVVYFDRRPSLFMGWVNPLRINQQALFKENAEKVVAKNKARQALEIAKKRLLEITPETDTTERKALEKIAKEAETDLKDTQLSYLETVKNAFDLSETQFEELKKDYIVKENISSVGDIASTLPEGIDKNKINKKIIIAAGIVAVPVMLYLLSR